LIEAVAASKSSQIGRALADLLPTLSPSVRSRAMRVLLGRADWSPALLTAFEKDPALLSQLALDQKLALTSHPNREIAARAKKLLAQGGGLPDPDRQQVIDRIAPLVKEGGDPLRGKLVFQQQCAKCHKHGAEGGQVGPDLTGMAAIPRTELLIHILDPSRSVEGNFVQYSVATTDGRMIAGLLASETKNSVELVDAEGKRHVILRGDIDQMAASKKSLMPEGFEKQATPSEINDLLAFLTQRGKYQPLDLTKSATVVTTHNMFFDTDSEIERLVFPDWSPKTVEGVPFMLVDPKEGKVSNAVLLFGPQGDLPRRMPRSVDIPCHTSARAIHFLSGVSGWGYPYGRKGSVSMIVRLHYADGSIENHPLENGVHFADYIRVVDVPGSKLAFRLGEKQIRYFSLAPKKKDLIDRIELVKGPDQSAPVVMAVTIEVAGAE
jgi:putative heme-binding domain-containing protein